MSNAVYREDVSSLGAQSMICVFCDFSAIMVPYLFNWVEIWALLGPNHSSKRTWDGLVASCSVTLAGLMLKLKLRTLLINLK